MVLLVLTRFLNFSGRFLNFAGSLLLGFLNLASSLLGEGFRIGWHTMLARQLCLCLCMGAYN